jgi:predicted N-acetyltransferase YhbS
MAVLQEYRRNGIAKKLWDAALKELHSSGVQYCEVWTQDDVAANAFYNAIGFKIDDSQTWIRCYAGGKQCNRFIDQTATGKIYGPEELVFDAPVSRKEELAELCYRINEVRMYFRTLEDIADLH